MRMSDRNFNLGLVLLGGLIIQWAVHTLLHEASLLWDGLPQWIIVLILSTSKKLDPPN